MPSDAAPIYPPSPPQPCPADLDRLIARSYVARHYWQLWRHGSLTFEQALIGIAAHLAEQNERYERLCCDTLLRDGRDAGFLGVVVERPQRPDA